MKHAGKKALRDRVSFRKPEAVNLSLTEKELKRRLRTQDSPWKQRGDVVVAVTLVAFATMYGSTKDVAEAIGKALAKEGLDADVKSVNDVASLEGYDYAVIGAPLIVGKLHKDARKFLLKHRQVLEKMRVAVFATGPVTAPRKEEEWVEARSQLDKQLAEFSWLNPAASEILGGKFDPAALRFPFNRMMGKMPLSDIRDFDVIAAWAKTLPAKLA